MLVRAMGTESAHHAPDRQYVGRTQMQYQIGAALHGQL
jgi:hypothetical protein